jgi:hypothetical protein
MLRVEITDDLPVYHYIKDGQPCTAVARSEYSAAATINFLRWRGHDVRIERSEDFMPNRKDTESMAERHADRLRELDATGTINAGGFTNKLVNKMIELGYIQRDELDQSLHITPAGRAHMETHPALEPEQPTAGEDTGYPITPAAELTYEQLMSLSPKQKLAVLNDIGTSEDRMRFSAMLQDLFQEGGWRGRVSGSDRLLLEHHGLTYDPGEVDNDCVLSDLGRFLMYYAVEPAEPDLPVIEEPTPPVFETVDELKRWWSVNPEAFDLQAAAKASGFERMSEELRRFEAKVWYERHNGKQQRAAVVDAAAVPGRIDSNWEHVLSLRSIRDDALAILENAAGEFGTEAARILKTANEMLDEMLS